MRIIRYATPVGTSYGIIDGDGVVPLAGDPFTQAEELRRGATNRTARLPLNELQLLAPCTPSKYIGFGMTYRSGGQQSGRSMPAEPILFLKPSTSIIGPSAPIILPKAGIRVIEEGELAVVISRRASNICAEEARHHIFGYTITNDVTDMSHLGSENRNFAWAKARNNFAPLGPWIETDFQPEDRQIVVRVNGVVCQFASTSELIFSAFELVSRASEVMTLLPGDVIATGTPAGARALLHGDHVEIEIEGIGSLSNPVLLAGASDELVGQPK